MEREFDMLAKDILRTFVNEIGLDGDYYVQTDNCPIIYVDGRGISQYISPEDPQLKIFLENIKFDEETELKVKERGLILVREDYKNIETMDSEFLVTIVHEKLHSNRNLLCYDARRLGKITYRTYTSNQGVFEQNTPEYSYFDADASQEILHGSIDTSLKTIDKYKMFSNYEIEDLDFENDEISTKMQRQQQVYEALVDLIAYTAYKVWYDTQYEGKADIWKAIEIVKNKHFKEDITIMSEIILKHHDLDLFYWMIDPFYYSGGDHHYDFFKQYTKDDSELVKKFYSTEDTLFTEEEIKKILSKTI